MGESAVLSSVGDKYTLLDDDEIDVTPYDELEDRINRRSLQPTQSTSEEEQTFSLKEILRHVNQCEEPALKAHIDKLCTEFQDLFRDEISATPAKVPPFHINYDEDAWRSSNKNSLNARPLAPNKQKELDDQIDKYLKLGIIEPSPNAQAWSQVLLVRKPNGTWRFCIDFRSFNAVSESKHWPLPNIRTLLLQLGFRKPRYFAVMDLTS
eukprot:gene42488-56468_t